MADDAAGYCPYPSGSNDGDSVTLKTTIILSRPGIDGSRRSSDGSFLALTGTTGSYGVSDVPASLEHNRKKQKGLDCIEVILARYWIPSFHTWSARTRRSAGFLRHHRPQQTRQSFLDHLVELVICWRFSSCQKMHRSKD